MNQLPGIKLQLTVDSMKHHMIQYLTDHQLDVPRMVEAELDKVLRDPGPLAQALSEQIARDLQESLGKEIKSALYGIWYRADIREQLQEAIGTAVRESILKNEVWRKGS